MKTDIDLPEVPNLARMRADRLAKLQAQMREQAVDAAVFLHGPHVTYATGFVPDALDASHVNHQRSIAIISAAQGGPVHLHAHGGNTDGLDAECLVPMWPELDEEMGAMAAAIQRVIGDIRGKRVAVDVMTGAMARSALFDGADWVDAARVLGPARVIKTDDELRCIDLAQTLTARAMEVGQAACVPGASRNEVAGAFLRRLNELGGHHCEIDTIIEVLPKNRGAGHRTSTGHVAFPTGIENPTFAEGDLVWVDVGVGYEGYASDFGRTWIVGRDPSAEEQALFDRWIAVMDAARAAIRPGASAGDVGRAATAADNGVVPWLPHFYLAHGVGLESAELPFIGCDLGQTFDDGFDLAPGMVIVLEPVIWQDGVGSYRAEEIVAVTETGWRPLGGGHHYRPYAS